MKFTTHIVFMAFYALAGVDTRNPFKWVNVGHAQARTGLS